MSSHRLVVGLGNPGPEYESTRHNVGFSVVARLVRAMDAFGPGSPCESEVFQADEPGRRWFLARPLTYMNHSGRAVACLVRRFGIALENLLVVYDDMALKVGQIRLRARGSSGGHRGMQSIIDALGTQEVPRLRIGIGSPPPGEGWVDYVLSVPGETEAGELSRALETAVEAVQYWGRFGMGAAMSRYNRR